VDNLRPGRVGTLRASGSLVANSAPAVPSYAPHTRPRAVPPPRLGLSGEDRRLPDARLQDGDRVRLL